MASHERSGGGRALSGLCAILLLLHQLISWPTVIGVQASAHSSAGLLKPAFSNSDSVDVDSTVAPVVATRSPPFPAPPTGSATEAASATSEPVRPILEPPASTTPAPLALDATVGQEEDVASDTIDSNDDDYNNNNDDDRIRESVVISTAVDAEKEAQDLYDKALKQYDSYGASARNICATWELRGCQCTVSMAELTLSCRNVGLETVPLDLPVEIVKLDLGYNNISTLYSKSFDMTPNLEELVLSDNSIARIDVDAFLGLHKLKRLSLHNCGLTVVPAEALRRINGLQTLQLDGNAIKDLNGISLAELRALRTLRLQGNMITAVPTEALMGLTSLEALNMASNHLFSINEGDFPMMPNLNYLLLKRNRISEVASDSIGNLTKLKILDLDENMLTTVPVGLDRLVHLQELYLSGNKIKWISKDDLPHNIITLELKANPLVGVKAGAMQNMPRLRKLVLSDARNLRDLPSLEGCVMLEILRMDRASLSNIPSDICLNSPRLKSLELKSNKLRSIPELSNCKDLRILDLSGNRIDSVHGKPFKGLGQLHDLLMSHNEIATIPYDAFFGIPKLQSLDLEGNKIAFIHDDAFSAFTQLEDLNLGNNIFPTLPRNGMQRILHLKTFNNPKLREFPPPDTFPRIQTLVLSYAYHCCPFIPLVTMGSPAKQPPLRESVFFPTDNEFDLSLWNNSQSDIWPQLHNLSKKFGSQINELWDSFGQDFNYPGNLPAYVEEYFEEDTIPTRPMSNADLVPGSVQCLPMPGPFLPCQDLFDWWTLRCGVWVVFLLAMLGNGTVVFVLIFSRSKMDVPRFLVCNLAAADFFMGTYLGILAVVDASTLGEFRMYAIPWQMSTICQLSGFLAVLSSELSVYTLAVITLERNYAITHAMHLNKRLSLRHAGYIMIVGWLFSLTMAMLPLIGISDYRKFAVCLPFETTNRTASLVYVVFLMFINGVAFLILMGCYLKMYCAIRGSQAWNSNDSRIAKRMALLVFTDFICWSPIAFLSLTAVFGLHLISLEHAKVFTVFVLPLNSCCNPFLYAIMTKQFKKDCVLICKAIEESRVTRGIGRCRHSSNFSNRQTPANTNSLAERSSKELPPLGAGGPGAIHTCACAKLLDHQQQQLPTTTGHLHNNHNNMHLHNNHNVHGHKNHHHHNQHNHHHHAELGRRGGITGESGRSNRGVLARTWDRIALCKRSKRRSDRGGGGNGGAGGGTGGGRGGRGDIRSDQYAYQIAEIQQKQYKRAGSVSSENFSSSRSDSWRHGPPHNNHTGNHHHAHHAQHQQLHHHHHHCGIPLRILDPRRRHSSWLVTRKTSQDSNLSSSRNDSSASATTASTSTFRMSRSSASGSTPLQTSIGAKPSSIGGIGGSSAATDRGATTAHSCSMQSSSGTLTKPRLVRQQAVQEETTDLSSSPPRLSVRFLPTIPSAADSSVILDDESHFEVTSVSAATPSLTLAMTTTTGATTTTVSVMVSAAMTGTPTGTTPSVPPHPSQLQNATIATTATIVSPITPPATVTTPFYTVLQSGSTTLTTLSSPKSIRKQPP